MRTDVPTTLQQHLDTGQTTLARCWRVERKDGIILGFTDHDRDLSFSGVTFQASTGFLGTELESSLGMSVDNMEVVGAIDSDQLKEEDIKAGKYDDAEIEVYLVNWQDVSERLLMKKGTLGEVTRGQTTFQAEFRGLSTQLSQSKGRVYQYKCDANVGDSRCKVNLSDPAFSGAGNVVGGNGFSRLIVSGLVSFESGWFTFGLITMTSGSNQGLVREIKTHQKDLSQVVINLWEPLPFEVQTNDTFSITAGCDKTFKTCKAKFNNAVNFRGFPHIPGSNTVIQYASGGEPNFDGGGQFFGKD